MDAPKRQFRKSKMTRKKIVDQAQKLFLTMGYADTTVAMIAKAIDVSYGTVYTYFNSKADIFVELMEESMKELYDMANTPFYPTDLKEAYRIIRQQTFSHLEFSLTNRQIMVRIQEAMYLSPEVRQKWDEIRNYFLGTITQDIRYSQQTGLLRKGVIPEISARRWYASNEFFLWEVVNNPAAYDIHKLPDIMTREYMLSIYQANGYEDIGSPSLDESY